jgi:diguanylate cyclase (GGDEF)-like protein
VVSTETAVAAISACAAVLALALALLAWQAMRRRSDRRFEAVLERLDEHLGGISHSLERIVERAEDVRARGVAALELAVDFDDLLRRVAVEAATRTGADGAAVQVVGPDGEPRSAEFGSVSGARSLDAPLAQATGPFRAVTINWSYRPGDAGAQDPVTSALVVPIVEDGRETGTISAYAPASAVFGPDQVGVLESLAEESGPGLAAARGFAAAQRELTDTLTGLRSPKGYDVELERAVDRARETGRPLSLLILGPDDIADVDSPATDVLRELAALLLRTTRATDVVCRRGEAQFGILLPDTAGDPARRLFGRLLEAASQTSLGTARQLTFASGLVEWRPDESGRALDARALAAVGRARVEPRALAGATEATTAPAPAPPPTAVDTSLRDAFQEQLAREIDRARHLERPLALLVAHVEGIARIAEAHGETAAERVLEEVESRLRELIGGNEIGARIWDDCIAVIHASSQAARAEELFSALHSSLESDPATHLDRLAVSAGISELAPGDNAAGLLDRAERALERASRAGSGTVVVEMAADEARD